MTFPPDLLRTGLAGRRLEPEVMDDPALDPAAHRAALDGLARINALSGTAGSIAGPLATLGTGAKVLDLACGGGDLAIALARRGFAADGCDLSGTALDRARSAAADAEVGCEFFQHDALADPLPTPADGGTYDAVTCSLFLHHLTADGARTLLAKAAAAAGRMVVVSDLRRTRTGLALAHLACRTLSRSPVVHVDGPRSVRAAFTVAEFRTLADAAGLTGGRLETVWPQRFRFVWETPDRVGPKETR